MADLIQPYAPRATVSEDADGLRITIPAKRSWVVLFLLVWISFWTFAGISTGRSLRQHFSFFAAFWMVGWMFGEVAVAHAILYAIAGREIVLANLDKLILRTEIFGLGIARSFAVGEIRDLRFQPKTGSGKSRRGSLIAFDYGARTISFAAEIAEPEAADLIARIRQRCSIASTSQEQESGIKFWRS